MKKLFLIFSVGAFLVLSGLAASARKSPVRHQVKAYTRKDGTRVRAHSRGRGFKSSEIDSSDGGFTDEAPQVQELPAYDNSEDWKRILAESKLENAEEDARRKEDAIPIKPYIGKFGQASGRRKVPYFTHSERAYQKMRRSWLDSLDISTSRLTPDKAFVMFGAAEEIMNERQMLKVPPLCLASDKVFNEALELILAVREDALKGNQKGVDENSAAASKKLQESSDLYVSALKAVYDDPKRQRIVPASHKLPYIKIPG